MSEPGRGLVLVNLAINARDALPTGGPISVSTRKLQVAGKAYCGWLELVPLVGAR